MTLTVWKDWNDRQILNRILVLCIAAGVITVMIHRSGLSTVIMDHPSGYIPLTVFMEVVERYRPTAIPIILMMFKDMATV